jgi:ankyrin repeat protein
MANVTISTPEPPVELLPSHIAAVKNDIEKLANLLQEEAPTIDPSTKETPLHAAAKTGSIEALKWLIKNKTVALTAKSSSGYTPAHLAAVYGHLDCLKVSREGVL